MSFEVDLQGTNTAKSSTRHSVEKLAARQQLRPGEDVRMALTFTSSVEVLTAAQTATAREGLALVAVDPLSAVVVRAFADNPEREGAEVVRRIQTRGTRTPSALKTGSSAVTVPRTSGSSFAGTTGTAVGDGRYQHPVVVPHGDNDRLAGDRGEGEVSDPSLVSGETAAVGTVADGFDCDYGVDVAECGRQLAAEVGHGVARHLRRARTDLDPPAHEFAGVRVELTQLHRSVVGPDGERFVGRRAPAP